MMLKRRLWAPGRLLPAGGMNFCAFLRPFLRGLVVCVKTQCRGRTPEKFGVAQGEVPRRVPRSTVSPHRLAWSRTPPFHGENRGSNPRGDASLQKPATRTSCGLSFWLVLSLGPFC